MVPDPSLGHVGDGSGLPNDSNSIEKDQHRPRADHGVFDLARSPVNVLAMEPYFTLYDEVEANFIRDGFLHGFPIQYSGPRAPRDSKNLRSTKLNPAVISTQIKKELDAGRIAGPFTQRPLPNLIVSPIGLVPKKSPGEFRMIHHLSYPPGESVNDYIDPAICSVQYTSFDEAVHLVQDLGQGCKLFKADIKSAYRLIPIKPADFELLGFCYNGKFYFDKALPFGASISCITFERFSRFLEFSVKSNLTTAKLIHYLDDFLGGDKTSESCSQALKIFENTMSEFGVPLATEKTEGPTEILVFLGLELDSENMVVRIPILKIQEIVQKIKAMLSHSKTTLKNVQSLIGSLNFCCRAIVIGRPFLRRLINSICGLSKPYYHVRIKKEVRLDLAMWLLFLQNHNGVSVFHDRFWVSNEDVQLFSDSAGGPNLGFGIYFKGRWCQAKWPESWHFRGFTSDITVLELFPILVAVFVWGTHLVNKKIRFNCDNMAVVEILNKLSSKSELVMCLVRLLTLHCMKLNILIKASHVPGHNNKICDALSRFQQTRFRELAPNADPQPCPVPEFLWSVFDLELEHYYNRG